MIILKRLLIIGFTIFFIMSCCTQISDFEEILPPNPQPVEPLANENPRIIDLRLRAYDSESYDVMFSNNKATITLPKYISAPDNLLVEKLTLSQKSIADAKVGSLLELQNSSISIITTDQTNKFSNQYQVTVEDGAPLLPFSLKLEGDLRYSNRILYATLMFKNKIWVIAGDNFDRTKQYNEVWSSPDGNQWTLENPNASFTNRIIPASVVYDDRMWIIGGQNKIGPRNGDVIDRNDVWSSYDGVNWTEETPNAPFSGRHSHTVVSFKGQIVLIGGGNILSPRIDNNTTNISLNDVWSSSDGINWTQQLVNAPFSGRRLHTSVVFDNKIWVIGGQDVNNNSLNDVWSSSDMINWTLETANAPFSPRFFSSSVVFDDKMWLIGRGNNVNDVWSSTNGIDWTQGQVTMPSPFPVLLSNVVTLRDKMFLLQNSKIFSSSTVGTNYIWSSSDGNSWKRVDKNFLPIYAHSTLNFQNKLWIISGIKDNGLSSDVWSFSGDENSMKLEQTNAFSDRYGHSATVFDNKMWVIGGIGNKDTFQNNTWSSSDGISWTEANSQNPFGSRAFSSLVKFNNKIWLIGGLDSNDNPLNDIWSSSDGINWTKIDPKGDLFPTISKHSSFVFRDKLWILGGRGESNFSPNESIWSSPDGIIWTEESDELAFPPREGQSVEIYNGRIWVFGGESQNGQENDVWSSDDGIKWKRELENGGFSKGSLATVNVFDDKFWLIGGFDGQNPKGNIWVSN